MSKLIKPISLIFALMVPSLLIAEELQYETDSDAYYWKSEAEGCRQKLKSFERLHTFTLKDKESKKEISEYDIDKHLLETTEGCNNGKVRIFDDNTRAMTPCYVRESWE